MSMEEILLLLKNLLPQSKDETFMENLALQSSYIVFDGPDEVLFKPGDAPKGFYWILSGQVMEVVSKDVSVLLGRGSMIGLEEFLNSHAHLSVWRTRCRTEALFIDSRCFLDMTKELGANHFNKEMANRLLMLKEACQGRPSVVINEAG